MTSIRSIELPQDALLRTYLDRGAYTDCYVAEVARPVAFADYVEAFYTTRVFKLERFVLAWLVRRASTDAQARALACGKVETFAAWNVEARAANQLLLSDFQGRTRSWLMSVPIPGTEFTSHYFGSAVVPIPGAGRGRMRLGFAFQALLGFHKLYSRVLLRAAVGRLARAGTTSA